MGDDGRSPAPVTGEALQRLRKRLAFPTQAAFAKGIGMSQQTISAVEGQQEPLGDSRRRRLLERLLTTFAADLGAVALIQETFGVATSPEDVAQGTAGKEIAAYRKSADERPAWVDTFRSEQLVERYAHLARFSGLVATRLQLPPYGLLLARPGSSSAVPPPRPFDDALNPHCGEPLPFVADTIVLFSSPYRHPINRLVLGEMLESGGVPASFGPDLAATDRPSFFFGYETKINDLYIGDTAYRSARYTDRAGRLFYEDYGLVAYGPLSERARVFGHRAAGAKHALVIAGAHRLATGMGSRIIENPTLRRSVGLEDEIGPQFGVIAFRVVVGRRDFVRVEDLTVIERWPRTLADGAG